jgi:hypothetical protein
MFDFRTIVITGTAAANEPAGRTDPGSLSSIIRDTTRHLRCDVVRAQTLWINVRESIS